MSVSREVAELISTNGPKYPNRDLRIGDSSLVRFNSMTDGRTTIVQITLESSQGVQIIGTGKSKRHPRDERNDELGMALAMTRAFTNAATYYANYLDILLNSEQWDASHPSVRAAKQLRKLNKDDARHRKNIRREKARLAHRELYGWDHNDRPVPGKEVC